MRTLVEEFNKEIDEEIKDTSHRILSGSCNSMEEYRASVYGLKSLDLAKETLQTILEKRLGESNDNDEQSYL